MPQVKKYRAEVTSVLNPVENIFTIEFRSLSGRFKYLPGQFLHLALDEYDPSFGWPESRCFSMQSSPSEEFIKITFSVKGDFTTRMTSELTIGRIVLLKLPFGELFQHDHPRDNVVFIAGGTGITPFLSIFNDPSFSDYTSPKLYLGFRAKDFNIYDNYLENARIINKSFEIEIKYQDTEGILDIKRITKANRLSSAYFISGPQIMISTFRQELIREGITQYCIFTDEWE
jgi:ferredoxin-NADP reductase